MLAKYRLAKPTPAVVPQAPSSAFPGSTAGVLDPVPIMTPAGPTDLGFLYQQMQGMGFLATAQTWTQAQSFSVGSGPALTLKITDAGGGADLDTLRPAALVLRHDTTAATVAGVGVGIERQVKDVAGNLTMLARDVVEITSTVAGAVSSTQAWSAMQAGQLCETFRVQGARGPTAVIDPNGGSTAGGASAGYVGGRLLCRGDVYHLGTDSTNNLPMRLVTHRHQLSTGSVLAGFGTEEFWETADGAGTVVPMARDQVLVATATAGAVDTLRAWSISMAGQEIEVMRIQALGMAPTSTGGITGKVGGRLLCQGQFRHTGDGLAFFGAAAAAKPTVSGSRVSGAALTSLLSALATLGLITDSSS